MRRTSRTTRRLAIALAVVAVLLAGARLALDPLVAWRTRRVLAGLHGMVGTFASVEVTLHDLSYTIHALHLDKVAPDGARTPYLHVERARFGLYAKELLRGHVVARVDLLAPVLTLVSAKKEQQGASQGAKEAPQASWGIEKLAPFRIDRGQVRQGTIRWIDASEPERPSLALHDLELTLENFATRKALSQHEPTVLAARGTLQRTGKVEVFATADPIAKKLTFAGQGRLDGLALEDLAALVAAKSGVALTSGTLDMTIAFRAVDGALSGGVRPILKGASTKAADPGLGPAVKSLLADAALEVFSDDVPGRNAVATTIPIRGSVDDPNAQAVPTIVGVLRNAFVRGVSDSLRGVPPPVAKKKESLPEQARRALSPGRGQPRAQPEGRR
jgi:hypothetical protein